MKPIKLLVFATTLVISTLVCSAQFSDNFDSYGSEAALDAVWVPSVLGTGTASGTSGMNLNTSEFVSSPNSVKNPSTTTSVANQAHTGMPGMSSSNFKFDFSFYDYNASSGSRDYGMLYDRAGGAWTGAINQILAIGKYNVGTANAYNARVAFGSASAVYGNGAVSIGTGWVSLTGGPARSIGWHTVSVTGTPDPINIGQSFLSIYIDSLLGGTVANVTPVNFNTIVLGSGLSSSGGFIAFDNVSVSVVPEPGTLVLGLLGGLGLLWVVRRRVA